MLIYYYSVFTELSYNVLVTVLGKVDFRVLSKTDSAVLELKP